MPHRQAMPDIDQGLALRAALSTYAFSVAMQALPGAAVAGTVGLYD